MSYCEFVLRYFLFFWSRS